MDYPAMLAMMGAPAGGFLGVVANVKEKTLVVKIADGVKVEIVRGAVSQVLDKGEAPETADAKY